VGAPEALTEEIVLVKLPHAVEALVAIIAITRRQCTLRWIQNGLQPSLENFEAHLHFPTSFSSEKVDLNTEN